jgi:glucose/arabinose dehydrogenase
MVFLFSLFVPQVFSDEKNAEILVDGYKIEKFVTGLSVPVAIDFIGSDIFVLQKNDGNVILIQDDGLHKQSILDLEVSNYGEQGLLGITTVEDKMYLFFTKAFHDGGLSNGNKIYEYTWDGKNISNPKLIKSLPGWIQGYNSGVMTHDLDNRIFAVSGSHYKYGALQNYNSQQSVDCRTDSLICASEHQVSFFDTVEQTLSCMNVSFYHYTTNPFSYQNEQPDITQNYRESNLFNITANLGSCIEAFIFNNFSNGNWKDTSVVLQVKPSVDSYHGIGIRNSFGLAVDPITGNLWMTDNGADKFDEINLVEKKFNSGWAKVMGPINDQQIEKIPPYEDYIYSDPEFSWELTVGITGIDFSDNSSFTKFDKSLFVADSNNGNIYALKLNQERNGFSFNSVHLQDLVVNIEPENKFGNFHESMDEIWFGKNFGLVTDIKFGPDGNLYVVSLMDGVIYRISPEN